MTQCSYDLNKDLRRKGALRQEIQRLKNQGNNYQFVIDSLCVAEEPRLGQLIQLIRSKHSIDSIADTWRLTDVALPDQLQAGYLLEFDAIDEGNTFGGSVGGPLFMGMATNQTNINISQSNLQANRPSINISASNVQINQPGVPMPRISEIAGVPDVPGVLGIPGISGVPVMPVQPGLSLNNATTFIAAEETQEAPLNLSGWYDEWGRLWPWFD